VYARAWFVGAKRDTPAMNASFTSLAIAVLIARDRDGCVGGGGVEVRNKRVGWRKTAKVSKKKLCDTLWRKEKRKKKKKRKKKRKTKIEESNTRIQSHRKVAEQKDTCQHIHI